jgi:hypothetical protein
MYTFIHHSASYCSILLGLLVAFILYRSRKYKDKGMLDLWRPYLFAGLVFLTIFAWIGFILLITHH